MIFLELCQKNKGRHYADRPAQLLDGRPSFKSGPAQHGSEPRQARVPILDLRAVEFE
jgi:hypothetical protein